MSVQHVMLHALGIGHTKKANTECGINYLPYLVNVCMPTDDLCLNPQEAKELLETNLSNCKANIKTFNTNLEVLKDYNTITEVSIARVYNYDVENRRKQKEAGSS